jgi:CMP-N-acetylneuraminic acid synthetase
LSDDQEVTMNYRARIAIIPARGGSKRLPRKNILDFHGMPMIAWTIQAALKADIFDRVIVSTEDTEIAEISRKFGAEVPFLRETNYDDLTPVSSAVIASLNQAAGHFGEQYETVIQLMPNCPLRGTAEILAAQTAFDVGRLDFQISCYRLGWTNPWWAMKLDSDGVGEALFSDAMKMRSQDLPPLFNPTGAIWIARAEALKAAGTYYGPGHKFQPMPWTSAIDIDNEDDLAFAKAVYLMKQSSSST